MAWNLHAIEQTQLQRQHRVWRGAPEIFISTQTLAIEMLGFDCAARMTRRPIRPNPLIPTRIDMVFFCACASTASRVAARYSVAAGEPREIFIWSRRRKVCLRSSAVHRCVVTMYTNFAARSARASANTRPSPRGNFELARHGATRQSAAVALK